MKHNYRQTPSIVTSDPRKRFNSSKKTSKKTVNERQKKKNLQDWTSVLLNNEENMHWGKILLQTQYFNVIIVTFLLVASVSHLHG